MSNWKKERAEREAFAALMALPVVNLERQSLRDAVPYSAKKLETMTKSWLSASPEFTVKRKAGWWNVTPKDPVYPAWTAKKTQAPCLPFESGRNVLPGMEAFAGLVSPCQPNGEYREAA
jgi:hypothetical protein